MESIWRCVSSLNRSTRRCNIETWERKSEADRSDEPTLSLKPEERFRPVRIGCIFFFLLKYFWLLLRENVWVWPGRSSHVGPLRVIHICEEPPNEEETNNEENKKNGLQEIISSRAGSDMITDNDNDNLQYSMGLCAGPRLVA